MLPDATLPASLLALLAAFDPGDVVGVTRPGYPAYRNLLTVLGCRVIEVDCAAETGSVQSETFKVMERRLLRAIINPAMIVTWLAGLYLAWAGHWFSAGWLHGKLLLVVVLSGVHGFFARCVKDFAAGRNQRSQKFYRVINEVPTVLMIGIVILVVVKPF